MYSEPIATLMDRPFHDILRGSTPRNPTIRPCPSSATKDGRVSSYQGFSRNTLPRYRRRFSMLRRRLPPRMLSCNSATRGTSPRTNGLLQLTRWVIVDYLDGTRRSQISLQ